MDVIINRIVSELKLQKKNQVDLAQFLGVTQNVITDWKSGRIKSYNKYIHGIAEFLGVSVEYLRGETDIKKPPIRLDRELSAHESVVLAAYRDQPAMQPAVDKLLGVDKDTTSVLPLDHVPPAPASPSTSTVIHAAALGGGAGESVTTLTAEEAESLKNSKNKPVHLPLSGRENDPER